MYVLINNELYYYGVLPSLLNLPGAGGVNAANRVGQQHENVSLLPSIDNPIRRKAVVGAIGEVVRRVGVEREGLNGV